MTISGRRHEDVHGKEMARMRNAYARRPPYERYSLLEPAHVRALGAKHANWASALRRFDHGLGTVLEVGCGTGFNLRWAKEVGAESTIGIDFQVSRLYSFGRSHTIGVAAAGHCLPIRDRSVDTVICSTLFSSILSAGLADAVAKEIDRVASTGSVVLWFDLVYRNPANPDVTAVPVRRLRSLFPGWDAHVSRVVLVPPLARRLSHRPVLSGLLELVPLLRSHAAGALVRRGR